MAGKRDGKLRLAIGLQGGGGDWLDPAVSASGSGEIATYIEYARIAEEGLFDFGFIADSAYITKDSTAHFLSRLEPMAALSAISAVTKHLGLVGTFSTSYSYPFTTARQLATLDKISDGRAGWNAVTSALEGVARNYNGDTLHPHALRYEIAAEYIEVVRGLWESWEDDAFVRDRTTGTYVDFDKMHTLDHEGKFFQVQGPLNIERSPQGHPVIFQAGASDVGRDLAARHADCIFSGFVEEDVIAHGKAFYADMKKRVAAYGRSPDDILVFPMVSPIVAETAEEAEARFQAQVNRVDINYALKYLSRYFSFYDFTKLPLDEALPDLGDIGGNSFKSTADYFLRTAREENLTLRELALRAATPRGGFIGSPTDVADKMELAFNERALDGFILAGSHVNLREFVRLVVPILQERGLFRTEYEATTLRGNLGLDYPENSHAVARAESTREAAE